MPPIVRWKRTPKWFVMIAKSVSGVKWLWLRCEGRPCQWLWWSGHSIVNRGPERLLTLVHSLWIITNITQPAPRWSSVRKWVSLSWADFFLFLLALSEGKLNRLLKRDSRTIQSVTNIFEYSNILVTNIYSDIRSYQFFFYKYIQTFICVQFVCTNIFGHSLVSVLECKT